MPGTYSKHKSGEELANCNFQDLENPWTCHALFLQNNYLVIRWLQRNGLLLQSWKCEVCGVDCNQCQRKKSLDGVAWRCPSRKHEYSIRKFSFFERSHFSFQDILQFIKCFLDNNTLLPSSKFSGFDYKKTSVDWANFIRDLFKQWVSDHYDNVQLSGDIEIDESLFGRQCKYHRGNPHVGLKVWIFGLVERETNRLLLFPVDRRDAAMLIPIIRSHVQPGSRIFSDGWAAYRELNDLGFEHFTVNHKVGFKKTYVNEFTGEELEVHTNTIEGCWKHAKQHFRRINGTSIGNFEGHMAEIMWRNWHKKHTYEAFFNLLKRYYTLEGPPHLDFVTPLFPSWSAEVRQAPQQSFVRRLDSSDEEFLLPLSGEGDDSVPRGAEGHIPLIDSEESVDSDSPLTIPTPTATSTPAIPSSLPEWVTTRNKKKRITSPPKTGQAGTSRLSRRQATPSEGTAVPSTSEPRTQRRNKPQQTLDSGPLSSTQKSTSTVSCTAPVISGKGKTTYGKGKGKYLHPKGFKPKSSKTKDPKPTSSQANPRAANPYYKSTFVFSSSDSDFC